MKILPSVVDRFEYKDNLVSRFVRACKAKEEPPLEPEKAKGLDYEANVLSMIEGGFDVVVYANCCKCKESVEVTGENINEIDPLDFYCGGSQRCCP